jgi:hypothetical protein
MRPPRVHKFPNHEILGPNGTLSKHLTDMIESAVFLELTYWTDRLNKYHGAIEDCLEKMDARRLKIGQRLGLLTSKLEAKRTDSFVSQMQSDGCIIVGVQENKMRKVKTCMYFPFTHESVKEPPTSDGVQLSAEEVYDAMITTGGGFKASEVSRTEVVNHYKGWSNCRVCGCNNGSAEMVHKNHVVPSGAMHYKQEHKLPLNLFSRPDKDQTKRIFYIAKKPWLHKKAVS